MVELVFDQPAVAFQSLYFQFGSEQSLHRDPMFVVTQPPSHLCAAWIALEDITPDAGPLLYAPGSHRMPWFEFDDDTVNVAVKEEAKDKRQEWATYRARMLAEMGLRVESLTCRRGDVFVWHGGLLHGGEPVRDPDATRKSYVVHYSTAAHYTSRRATMKMKMADERGEPVWRNVGGTTERLLVEGTRRGIDNPLREMQIPAAPARGEPRRRGWRSLLGRS
jgi:ectoine hydroxylase-related dioxygenase (phytanoyl-CoA dioxygenase family)